MRSGSAFSSGNSKATSASASLRLARTMRCAMVGSGTRKARAISPVLSPPSSFSVSAMRDSGGSTGWQAMSMRRKRSSPTSVSRTRSMSGMSVSSCSWASDWCFSAASFSWRQRSTARRFAVVISQAPGLSGTPCRGQVSSAVSSASWARSSASETSCVRRTSPAITRGDSTFHTPSTKRRMSVSAVFTVADHNIIPRRAQALLLQLRCTSEHLDGAEALGVSEALEVLQLVQLAHLDFAVVDAGIREAPRPLEGFLAGARLDQRVAGDKLPGFGKRPVGDGLPAVLPGDAPALAAGMQAGAIQQHAGAGELLVVGGHGIEYLLARHQSRFRLGRGLDDDHESHGSAPRLGFMNTTREASGNRQALAKEWTGFAGFLRATFG